MTGQTQLLDESTKQYDGIVYMPCNPQNEYFPDLKKTTRADIVYFCSPNNPTGAAATKTQLKELVDFCIKNGSILVFDQLMLRSLEIQIFQNLFLKLKELEIALSRSIHSQNTLDLPESDLVGLLSQTL